MLTYEIDRNSDKPVYIQIYRFIKRDIESGRIKSGEKLPSKRGLADNLGVSVITVENAYSLLTAEGYIRSVPKKGYYAESLPDIPTAGEPLEISAEELPKEEEQVPNMFPFTVWTKIMREELTLKNTSLMTSPAEGVFELRRAIAEHLHSFRNMDADPRQIIIGAGTEYLYILIRILLGDKKVIAVEEPGYSKIANVYESLGMKCRQVSVESDGISIDELVKSQADVVHISPSHHFPTGVVTSVGKRYSLLSWAAGGRYIIEDDYDSEFRLSSRPLPSLFSIDVSDRVIYMNTFSKSLTPTIRISYMVLPPALIEKFRGKIRSFSCPVSTFEQYTLARFISDGSFERHIRRLRRYCKNRREELMKIIAENPLFKGAEVSGSSAGMHCIVKFRTKQSDAELLESVRATGFKADLLREHYRYPPAEDLHTLVIYS